MRRFIVLLLLLVGCTSDTDRFAEFEAEYEPAMQVLGSLMKATEQSSQDSVARALTVRCKSVGEEVRKRSFVMLEKANALRNEEARKLSTTIASDLKDAAVAVEDLGGAYAARTQIVEGITFPGENRFAHLYDDIFKASSIKQLATKIESEYAALKGVMARK